MSKFDYMNFSVGGYDTEFVAHAGKYTKEQVINLCIQENDWKFKPNYCNGNLLRVPTICDVKLRYARWYVKTPENCEYDDGRGCYSYCKAGQKGSFPVWVIEFEKLQVQERVNNFNIKRKRGGWQNGCSINRCPPGKNEKRPRMSRLRQNDAKG